MKTAFLYAGQGAQTVGMGQDIYEAYEAYRKVLDAPWVDPKWKKLIVDGPMEELTLTENTQPCMALFAAGVTEVLREKGIVADIACGLSLGEYGALYAAGVWDTQTYVELLGFRGGQMARAAEGLSCSMSAIMGVAVEDLEKVINECAKEGFLVIANYNCTKNYTICGENTVLEKAEGILKENYRAKCMRLKVSGPFHTKYMEPVGAALTEKFGQIQMSAPAIPVAMNVTGQLLGDGDIVDLLARQVYSSVRFEDCLRRILESGVERVIEIGPGKALAGYCKKTYDGDKDIEIISIRGVEDIEKL